jgi:sugar lactone lactonase YvrE
MGSQSILQPRNIAFLCLLLVMSGKPSPAQTLATSIPLVLPSAVAFDRQGNLYFAETGNHVIRKIDTSGQVTTVVGTGTQGFDGDGGAATAALLDSPQGLAVDSTSLYIADTHNHRIRRVQLGTGMITTIAGSSTAGSSGDNGSAAAATLDSPTALALDSMGNLFLADSRVHRIRRIDAASGIITSVAGTGTQGFDGDGATAASALLDSPGGLAVDTNGNLYVADTHNNRIRRIDAATQVVSTIAGSGGPGFTGDSNLAVTAMLALPHGISLDPQGNVYFADTANHRIRRIDAATGNITTITGEGTQGFGGDGGAATAASLDSPRSTVVSSTGLATIADTGNQRIRQITAGSALQTIAGFGATIPGSLALNGPSVVVYGSGQLFASLTSASSGQGIITFLDRYAGSLNGLATVPLTGITAVLDTSQLAAGEHSITATYAGDSVPGAAQSTAFVLTVSPLPLTVVVTPSSVSYGETVPSVTGTLRGILPRDQSSVSASFSTTASALSPVGSYPVIVTLTGAAAGNYSLGASPAFAILPAATITTLSITSSSLVTPSVSAGDPVTLTVHVASQTTGIPTGSATILDGSSILTSGRIDSSGDMTFVSSALGMGSHGFTVVYSGDTNYKGSTSSVRSITVNGTQTPADFTLVPTGITTQSIVSGTAASFTFETATQGGLSSPISLSASGLPNLATASFNPSQISPGSAPNSFTLTITTPKTARIDRQKTTSVVFAFLFLPPGLLFALARLHRSRRIGLLAFLILTTTLFGAGCGDRIYTGTRGTDTSKIYAITVTGTATSPVGTPLQHTSTVTLVVLPAD